MRGTLRDASFSSQEKVGERFGVSFVNVAKEGRVGMSRAKELESFFAQRMEAGGERRASTELRGEGDKPLNCVTNYFHKKLIESSTVNLKFKQYAPIHVL